MVTLPTFLRLGSPEPVSMPAAFFNSTDAGGVFSTKVKLRSCTTQPGSRRGHESQAEGALSVTGWAPLPLSALPARLFRRHYGSMLGLLVAARPRCSRAAGAILVLPPAGLEPLSLCPEHLPQPGLAGAAQPGLPCDVAFSQLPPACRTLRSTHSLTPCSPCVSAQPAACPSSSLH